MFWRNIPTKCGVGHKLEAALRSHLEGPNRGAFQSTLARALARSRHVSRRAFQIEARSPDGKAQGWQAEESPAAARIPILRASSNCWTAGKEHESEPGVRGLTAQIFPPRVTLNRMTIGS